MLVIVPCGRAKIWDGDPSRGPTPARDAYTGPPFTVNRHYAERFGKRWVILSAKYGFVWPDDEIPGPYNVTFNDAKTAPIGLAELRRQCREMALHEFATVIGLGGKEYRLIVSQVFASTPTAAHFPFANAGRVGDMMSAINRSIQAGDPFLAP